MTIKKSLPKAIIFDWDNTLVDTWPAIHQSIDATMVKMGHEPWGLQKVKDKIGKSMRESFPELFGDKWQEAGNYYRDHYNDNNLRDLQLLEGARELLDRLIEMDITLFVVSNKMGNTLRNEVEHLGLKNHFFAAIGAMDAKADKPSKEPVDLALMGSDIDLESDLVWFVGDSEVDIECAYNSNCQPVFYGDQNKLPQNLIEKINNMGRYKLIGFKSHQEIDGYLY